MVKWSVNVSTKSLMVKSNPKSYLPVTLSFRSPRLPGFLTLCLFPFRWKLKLHQYICTFPSYGDKVHPWTRPGVITSHRHLESLWLSKITLVLHNWQSSFLQGWSRMFSIDWWDMYHLGSLKYQNLTMNPQPVCIDQILGWETRSHPQVVWYFQVEPSITPWSSHLS